MKQAEIVIGATYEVLVSGRLAPVQVISSASRGGFANLLRFKGVNVATGRTVGPFTAARCRRRLEHFIGPEKDK